MELRTCGLKLDNETRAKVHRVRHLLIADAVRQGQDPDANTKQFVMLTAMKLGLEALERRVSNV